MYVYIFFTSHNTSNPQQIIGRYMYTGNKFYTKSTLMVLEQCMPMVHGTSIYTGTGTCIEKF